MRIRDWSSEVWSSDLGWALRSGGTSRRTGSACGCCAATELKSFRAVTARATFLLPVPPHHHAQWHGDERPGPGEDGDCPENRRNRRMRRSYLASLSLAVALALSSPFAASTAHAAVPPPVDVARSEEHTSELQSLMRISYAVFCLKKKI